MEVHIVNGAPCSKTLAKQRMGTNKRRRLTTSLYGSYYQSARVHMKGSELHNLKASWSALHTMSQQYFLPLQKRSENQRWLADDENVSLMGVFYQLAKNLMLFLYFQAISKYQRQIEDPSTNEERREELKTLVQFWDSYVQNRKITVLETESDITKKMNGEYIRHTLHAVLALWEWLLRLRSRRGHNWQTSKCRKF